MPVRVVVPVLAKVSTNPPLSTVVPKTVVPPETVVMVGAAVLKVTAGLRVMVKAPALFVIAVAPALKVKALPPITKAPAPLLKVMEAKLVPAAKSLLGVGGWFRRRPSCPRPRVRCRPNWRYWSNCRSRPPPFQVRVAACKEDKANSRIKMG